MIRERVSVKDFKKIAKEHKYFLWHFLMKEQENTTAGFYSYFLEKNMYGVPNSLKLLIDKIDIPYFESYTQESMDFLYDVGINVSILYKPDFIKGIYYPRERYYHPIIIGFNHYTRVSSTTNYCYCVEGVTNILLDLNPELILNVNFD